MKKVIILIMATILVMSCKNDKNKIDKPTQTEEGALISKTLLKLNNGDLWIANTETSEGVQQMTQLITNFSDTENRQAYSDLKEKLEVAFGSIIAKCTMTGESHNQLHNYLLPLKPLFEELESSNVSTRKSGLAKLRKYLSEYSTYFK